MAIRMKRLKRSHRGLADLSAPRFVCDECEQVIEDAEKALYVWDMARDDDEPGGAGIATVHKGACDRAFEARSGFSAYGTMPLSLLPVYLGGNSGIRTDEDWSRVRRWVAEM